MLATRTPAPDPKGLARLIEKNLEIPTIPVVGSRALKELSNPQVNGARLAAIIAEDQGLTARLLKVSNSSLFALSREVKNVQQATMILGFDLLKSIIVGVSCRMVYKRFGIVEKTMWDHSVGTAVVAHVLAKAKGLKCRNEAFVSGLMHDVGQVVMNNGAREQFAEAVRWAKERDVDVLEGERAVFGFSHVDVGAVLVSRWGLSRGLEQAVLLHHEPELASSLAGDAEELVLLTALANRICHSLGIGELGTLRPGGLDDSPLAEELGFAPGELLSMKATLLETFRSQNQALA
jgi:HD-like signal output (HDOD) protein